MLASAAGTVTVGFDSISGNFVTIDHGSGWSTYYGHLDEVTVSNGVTVARGTKLGTVGQTGAATGSHVHYEQRLNGSGKLPIRFDGNSIEIGSAPPGPTFTSTNCGAAQNGRVWVHALKKDGKGFFKRTDKGEKDWRGFTQLSGRWSSLTSAVDSRGRVWMVGVKTDGKLRYRYTNKDGWGGWTKYKSIGGSGWKSVTTTVDQSGRVWVHALKKDGKGFFKSTDKGEKDWRGFTQLSGRWSSLTSAVDSRGRVWMVGVKTDGKLRYRYTKKDGWGGWTKYKSIGGSGWKSVTTSVD